ncbi:MAG: phosphoenolpyruvate--protein phosphotransferase [Pirellulaceae bacterium]|nr:phosphoenolpyruvate--protein phosphotransferase [Pirellulaceae bacterium]
MQIYRGIAASPGVAIGEAMIVDHEGFRIPRRFVVDDAVNDELRRLHVAIEEVAEEIARNRDAVSEQLGEQYGAIFSAHLQMLRDRSLIGQLESLVREKYHSPEYAVSTTLKRYAKVFHELESDTLVERAQDIFDIEKSLLAKLLGHRREELSQLKTPTIVLAHALTPSEVASFDPRYVLAFSTETGGAGGHSSIIAQGLEIPAVVGIGSFLTEIAGGDLVIIDGDHGTVILDPDEQTLQRYQQDVEDHRTLEIQLDELRELPAETLDQESIYLAANIEFPHEVQASLRRGAVGIGLYRTEFLYLASSQEPSEEEHYQAYAHVVRSMKQRPVVIRTLDLGADKMGLVPRGEEERNPFLGLRSIRLSLQNLSLFRIQLRAILRASTLGPVQVMFPLVATLQQLRQARRVLEQVMYDLRQEGIDFDEDIPIGMMIEVPSAVMVIDRLLKEVDFISIGTNDLIQYTLAVDRSNKDVADLYEASDPGVLRLIERSIQAANDAQVPVTLCGQMSGMPVYIPLLLGLGLRGFSVPPSSIPEVKRICRSVNISQCKEIADQVMNMEDAQQINQFLTKELQKIAPELVA